MSILSDFLRSNEYKKQRVAVVFRYQNKISVVGLWGKCFLESRDFTRDSEAITWFRYLKEKYRDEERRIKTLWRF